MKTRIFGLFFVLIFFAVFFPVSIASAQDLTVTPSTDRGAAAFVGSTPIPSSFTYTLGNTSASSLTYAFGFTGTFHNSVTGNTTPNSAWITLLDNGTGTLGAGANSTLDANIGSGLAEGMYIGSITFTNTTNGSGNTSRNVNLAVNPVDEITVTSGPSGTPNPVGPGSVDLIADPHAFDFIGAQHDSVSGGVVQLNVAATDSLGHTLNYSWSASCPTLGSSGLFNNPNTQNPTWTAPGNLLGGQQQCTISVQINDTFPGTASKNVSYSQGVLGTIQNTQFTVSAIKENPLCFRANCNIPAFTFSVKNESTAPKNIQITVDKTWISIDPGPTISDLPISGDSPTASDLVAPGSTSVATTLNAGQTATFSAKINTNIKNLWFAKHTASFLITDVGTGNIVTSFSGSINLIENPMDKSRSQMVIAPYWQAEAGIYSFVVASHPSLKNMNSQIGVKMTAILEDGAPFSLPVEFTINSNESKRVFITSTTNTFMTADNFPNEIVMQGLLTESKNGQLVISPSSDKPLSLAGIANSLGRGFPDIRMLSFWGAAIVQNTSTGFTMEFIGDMQDSRAFSSPNFSGVN